MKDMLIVISNELLDNSDLSLGRMEKLRHDRYAPITLPSTFPLKRGKRGKTLSFLFHVK